MTINQKTLDIICQKLKGKFTNKHKIFSFNKILVEKKITDVKPVITNTTPVIVKPIITEDNSTARQIIKNGKPLE